MKNMKIYACVMICFFEYGLSLVPSNTIQRTVGLDGILIELDLPKPSSSEFKFVFSSIS